MVMVPPTKVLSAPADSLGRTGDLFLLICLLEKDNEVLLCVKDMKETTKQGSYGSGVLRDIW
jgi:hypothetical protein